MTDNRPSVIGPRSSVIFLLRNPRPLELVEVRPLEHIDDPCHVGNIVTVHDADEYCLTSSDQGWYAEDLEVHSEGGVLVLEPFLGPARCDDRGYGRVIQSNDIRYIPQNTFASEVQRIFMSRCKQRHMEREEGIGKLVVHRNRPQQRPNAGPHVGIQRVVPHRQLLVAIVVLLERERSERDIPICASLKCIDYRLVGVSCKRTEIVVGDGE
jgi:hypothetical protein